jgi:hypothetical protein
MKLPDIDQLIGAIPAREERDITLIEDQDVNDIIHHVKRLHKKYASDYDKISSFFWRGNVADTCKCIFDFCKRHIRYDAEKKDDQTIANPRMILLDAAVNDRALDCKHLGQFTCGIVDSLHRKGYPISCVFRFANDSKGQQYPKHVFSVVRDEDGNKIWVDPVLSRLNEYHKYYYFQDEKPPKVALRERIAGVSNQRNSSYIGSCSYGFGFDDDDDSDYVGKAKKKKGFLKNIHIKLPKIKIQPGKLLKKIALAPSRNALLALLKLNAFQIAHSFYVEGQTPAGRNNLKNIWEKIGGQWSHFVQAVNQGERIEKKHHGSKTVPGQHDISGNYVGVVGADDAAIAAVASAAIAFFASILKKHGVNTSNLQSSIDQGTNDLANLSNAATGSTLPDGTTVSSSIDPSTGQQTIGVQSFQGNQQEADPTSEPLDPNTGDMHPAADPSAAMPTGTNQTASYPGDTNDYQSSQDTPPDNQANDNTPPDPGSVAPAKKDANTSVAPAKKGANMEANILAPITKVVKEHPALVVGGLALILFGGKIKKLLK